MVGCPSSLLKYSIIAMAVDYDIKNENYNKNRRTGSDRPSYLLSSFTRAARVFFQQSSTVSDLLGQLGSMEKRRETPDSRSPARPNLNIGLRRKVSQHPKQTEELISMHTSAIAVLSQISLSQKREAH